MNADFKNTLLSYELHEYCGGKGLNQSIALAKAGLDVWHAGIIGIDRQMLLDACSQADGSDIQTALRTAAKASSIAVTREGAAPSIPTMEEVELSLSEEQEVLT